MARYLIPKPIAKQYELFPGSGWGLPEAGIVVAGVGLAGVVFWVLTLCGVPVVVRLVVAIVIAASGVGIAYPPPLGEPFFRVGQRWWQYQHHPHRYLYDVTQSDWPDNLNPQ